MSALGQRMLEGLREVVDNLDSYIERQRYLEDHSPECPECHTKQVHLLRLNEPAIWVCKECRHKFTLEPDHEVFNEDK